MAIILLLALLLLLIYQLGWARLYDITNNTKQAQIHLLNSLHTHCRFAVALPQLIFALGPKLEYYWLLQQRGGKKRRKILLALKAFAQKLYITLAHISLTKASHTATHKFNKVEIYNRPAEKLPPRNGILGEQYYQLHYY